MLGLWLLLLRTGKSCQEEKKAWTLRYPGLYNSPMPSQLKLGRGQIVQPINTPSVIMEMRQKKWWILERGEVSTQSVCLSILKFLNLARLSHALLESLGTFLNQPASVTNNFSSRISLV